MLIYFSYKGDLPLQNVRLWTAPFLTMCGSNFFLFISQYILIAALPIYIMESLGGGEIEAGLAMTCFQIGTVVCRPIAGRIIDHVNKKHLLIGSAIVFLLIMIGFYLQHSTNSVYALRLFHGIIFALSTTASAAAAVLVIPAQRRGEGIGYYALSTNLAMVVGPLIGLVLIEHFGASSVFLFLIAIALATLITVFKSPLPKDAILPQAEETHGNPLALSNFIEYKALMASLLGGLVFFSYGAVLTFIPLYTRSLGLQSETSLFFSIFALVIIVTRPIIGLVFDRKGPNWTVYPGFLSFLVGMLLFSRVSSVIDLFTTAVLLGLGFGALAPAFQTLAVMKSPSSRAGVATATYFWSLDISVGLAAAILGVVAKHMGYSFMYGVVASAVIAIACIIYFVWSHVTKIVQGK